MKQYKYGGYLIKLAVFIAVYFATARFGLGLSAVSGFAALVWLPTGIALAALLIYGYRLWPGIAVAAFLVNLITGADPLVALGIAAGNSLEALLGAYLLNRFVGFQHSLERLRDVLGLIIFAALLSTLVSATIGVTSLWLGGVIRPSAFAATWVAWWIGDMLGALVIAPLILVWSRRPYPKFGFKKCVEVAGLTALLVGVGVVVFRGAPEVGVEPFTLAFFIFPILIMVALRFGMRGSVSATFVVSVAAVWSTLAGVEAPEEQTLNGSLLLVQSFVGVTAVTFMTMAAIMAEVMRSQRKTVRLAKQRAHLLALNKSKDEFIALASHQLRTPATSVKQYTGMLLDNYAGKLNRVQRDMLRTAYESNERQLQVVNSLLSVAQIDAGNVTLQKERVDIVSLISDIVASHSAAIAARDQSIVFKHAKRTCVVSADASKLGMVIENIIDNASKYSLPGCRIEIKLVENKEDIVISVKDQGVGMSKHDMKKLFKKFSRIDNAMSVEASGSGLGLYWAKKVVDLHGGTITVTSQPNDGSTFSITLLR